MAIHRKTPEAFLATHALFTRAELAASLEGRAEATVGSHLSRWKRQGRLAAVKRGLFVRLDSGEGAGALPDFIALASRMAPDAAAAYHTALEAHGHAQSLFERLTFVTWTKARPVEFMGRRFVPVRSRQPLVRAQGGERWIERVERGGITCRVTTPERTVADVLDRPDLSGGIDEVWRSLAAVPALDAAELEAYVRLLGSPVLAAKVGYFLDSRGEELAVPPQLLDRLRKLVPAAPCFMDRRRKGRLVARWALIVPADLTAGEPEVQE